jgi:murein peptide amidase A
MSAVKAAPFDPAALVSQFESAGLKAGFTGQEFGKVGAVPLLALTKRTAGKKPRIYLSAGIHGDEPAAPLTLLSMLESGDFDARAVWFLCPLLNPAGFSKGVRENAAGTDLNRDYRHLESPEIQAHVVWLKSQPNFDLAVCVHEDWESKGFYLYELNPDKRPSLAENMIKAVSKACPIELSPVIEGREAKGGIIRPSTDPLEREKWPEAVYLLAHHTRFTYTVESPSSLPLETRLAALRTALRTAIGLVTRPRS